MTEDDADSGKPSKVMQRSKTTKPSKSDSAAVSDLNQAEVKSSRGYATLPANSRLDDPGTLKKRS